MTLSFRIAALAAILGLAAVPAVQAATCADEGFAGIVQNVSATGSAGNSGCYLGGRNNDTQNPVYAVDADAMFGATGWVTLTKTDTGSGRYEGGNAYGVTVSGNGYSGSWSVGSSVWDDYAAFMIVLKGGKGGMAPANYVGYAFTMADGLSGSYASPFAKRGTTEISHVTVYGIRAADAPQFAAMNAAFGSAAAAPAMAPAPVPLPAASLGLVSGLALLGGLRLRRRRRG
ncbi:hypothetical protein [Mangrovicoccus algicola]|uniref:PEP-CTERM sorting domain-containing protein n=1 Tax=Mangrovicoccus algicola TaxID=2771008 RepID=A0A8J6Z777_9RHOB|nr:hypothetical protein [Mangrovicoccus algicola]MBE3637745.1 hypothetical protein [Mangrovicoccus algicola]